MSKVTKEENYIYVRGIPQLKWGIHKDSTYCGAVAEILNAMDIPATYEEVMGISGNCYKLAVEKNYDPAAIIAQVGPIAEKNVNQYYGIDVYSIRDAAERDNNVISSIEKGVPVLLCGGRGIPEWSLITGYFIENEKNRFFGRSYCDSFFKSKQSDCAYTPDKYLLADRYPGDFPQDLMRFYDRPCSKIPFETALKNSLKICVAANEQTVMKEGPFTYYFGQEAYTLLIKGLKTEDNQTCLLNDCQNNTPNWPKAEHYLGSIIDYRNAASVFLKEAAKKVEKIQAEQLEKTAKTYQDIVATLTSAIPYEHTTPVIAGVSRPAYSYDMRLRVAQALEEVKKQEEEVLKQVKHLLYEME